MTFSTHAHRVDNDDSTRPNQQRLPSPCRQLGDVGHGDAVPGATDLADTGVGIASLFNANGCDAWHVDVAHGRCARGRRLQLARSVRLLLAVAALSHREYRRSCRCPRCAEAGGLSLSADAPRGAERPPVVRRPAPRPTRVLLTRTFTMFIRLSLLAAALTAVWPDQNRIALKGTSCSQSRTAPGWVPHRQSRLTVAFPPVKR